MPTFKTQEVRRIVGVIYKAIIERRLPAGTRLIEIKLSEALKANRNHVRSALQELQNRGVVDIETNKGACVASPSREKAREVFEARRAIEGASMRQAVEYLSSDDIAELEKLIREEQVAVEKNSRPDMIRLSGEFHLEISRISGNTVLTEILDRLVASSSLIIGLYEAPNSVCSNEEHIALLTLMRDNKSNEAVAFMERHLDEIEARLLHPEDEEQEVDFTKLLAG